LITSFALQKLIKIFNSSESIWGRWDDMVNKESLKLYHKKYIILVHC
jgi:hypothetical protein